jgi:hypothetical protein
MTDLGMFFVWVMVCALVWGLVHGGSDHDGS